MQVANIASIAAPATLQVDNKSSTEVTQLDIKLHQRLHLTCDSFLGSINKHIDVVRVATRCAGRLVEYPSMCVPSHLNGNSSTATQPSQVKLCLYK
jgi:hypothetical protein